MLVTLEIHGPVQEGPPPDKAGSDKGQGADCLVFALSGILILVVEVDAHAHAGADAAVHDGQFPVLAVVDLAAADEDGGAHEQDLDLTGTLVGERTEILAETEQLGAVRLFLPGGVVVVLREGVLLELVVPCLTVEQGRHKEGDEKGQKAQPGHIGISHGWVRGRRAAAASARPNRT